MTKKQQLRIYYTEEISIKSDAKNTKLLQITKKLLQVFVQFSGLDQKQKIRINYIAEISIKSDANQIKYYQI